MFTERSMSSSLPLDLAKRAASSRVRDIDTELIRRSA